MLYNEVLRKFWTISRIKKKKKILEFYSVKLEKKSEENKLHKFIWLRGEENNFLRFYKLEN